jgi:copper chaperone CopZ
MNAVFEVHGMTCGGCEQSVVRALLRVDGVRVAHASHIDRCVDVESSAQVDEQVIRLAIEDAGFEVVGLRA